MVVDTSVLLQILFNEEGAAEAVYALDGAEGLMIATPTLLETEIVYGAQRGFSSGDVTELVNRLEIGVCPFTTEHVLEAKLAYARYGKGRGHAAALNFGDCVSYALAKVEGQPLAFKGEDFNHTDLNVVKLG